MCGHRFKEHTKASHKCANGSCKCAGFFYIIAEGAWILRCRCKHKHIEHDCTNLQHKCLKPGCKGCTGFDSPFVCNCDHPWSSHEQVTITITPSVEAMSAFSEVCGGAAGVQRGGVDLSAAPMALMGCPALPPPPEVAKAKAPSISIKPSVSVAAEMSRPNAQQQQPLVPSRSANCSSINSATDISKFDSRVDIARTMAAPSRIPSSVFNRPPSIGR
jgi:hypothetical protein